MKSHAIKLLFLLTVVLCMVMTALAADTGARSTQIYPISMEEHTEGRFDELCIRKIYQLSLSAAVAGIPMEDFERNGHVYHLLDHASIKVEVKGYTTKISNLSATRTYPDLSAVNHG